jgi:hypothetical protein
VAAVFSSFQGILSYGAVRAGAPTGPVQLVSPSESVNAYFYIDHVSSDGSLAGASVSLWGGPNALVSGYFDEPSGEISFTFSLARSHELSFYGYVTLFWEQDRGTQISTAMCGIYEESIRESAYDGGVVLPGGWSAGAPSYGVPPPPSSFAG